MRTFSDRDAKAINFIRQLSAKRHVKGARCRDIGTLLLRVADKARESGDMATAQSLASDGRAKLAEAIEHQKLARFYALIAMEMFGLETPARL